MVSSQTGVDSDHPRIRGEHDDSDQYSIDGLGSSPHTRGARSQLISPAFSSRIIPAYAGSTRSPSSSSPGRADHPRIRGEHDPGVVGVPEDGGSSPHTRGAPGSGLDPAPQGRIIPAYAGSTTYDKTGSYLEPDHPRIRGEHFLWWWSLSEAAGSSPHTRGAPHDFRYHHDPRRIIPAYAGSTASPSTSSAAFADHPRIRGEHAAWIPSIIIASGSSPHTRGARQAILHVSSLARIIPAYAGSTVASGSRSQPRADHPRIRGEHPRKAIVCPSNEGSSPHTRGAPRPLSPSPVGSRIIPAYAGSTVEPSEMLTAQKDHPRIRGEHGSTPSTPEESMWIIPAYAGSTVFRIPEAPVFGDHPRIRGEHRRADVQVSAPSGSSPHTRGARRNIRRGRRRRRIIPAYAGSTAWRRRCR